MKRLNLYLLFIITATGFFSCDKNEIKNAGAFNEAVDQAQVKVNIFSHYRSNPSLQIKVNDQRVSNALTAATPFPGGGLNTGGGSTADYLAIAPGSDTYV